MKKSVFNTGEIGIFCGQLQMVLQAGISLMDGLEMIKEEVVDETILGVLTGINHDLAMGEPLEVALSKAGVFPNYLVQMVRVGNETGKLDNVLGKLAIHYEKEAELKGLIRKAVMYPCVLVGMMLVVLTIILVKVLPIFENILHNLGSELSGGAAGLVGFGSLLRQHGMMIGCILVLVIAVGFYIGASKKNKLRATILKHSKTYYTIGMYRFTDAMAMMLESGIELNYALSLSRELVDHPTLAEAIGEVQEAVKEGASFVEVLASKELMSSMHRSMLGIGVGTGYIDRSMRKVAEDYEGMVDQSLMQLIGRIEPISIGILSVLIGGVLLAVMLPLMEIMSSIG